MEYEWEIIEETTPSGKQLYKCKGCGTEDPAPRKYHDCVKILKCHITILEKEIRKQMDVAAGYRERCWELEPLREEVKQFRKKWESADDEVGRLLVEKIELQAEVERLRNQLNLYGVPEHGEGTVTDWKSMYVECHEQIDKLRRALEKYGHHLARCDKLMAPLPDGILAYGASNDEYECTCDFEKV